MNLATLNQLDLNESFIHRIDGRVKTCFYLVAIIISVSMQHLYSVIGLLSLSLIVFLFMQMPWRRYFKRMTIPFEVAWLVLLNLLFTQGHTVIWRVNLYFWVVPAYREGLYMGILVLLRIITSVSFAVLLILSTPMEEILATLRILRIPSIIIDIAEMMYRYILLVEETATTMRRAQLSRGGGWLPWYKQASDVGIIAGSVLIKALDRSTRIYKAMLSRGYDEDVVLPSYFESKIPLKDLISGLTGGLTMLTLLIVDITLR